MRHGCRLLISNWRSRGSWRMRCCWTARRSSRWRRWMRWCGDGQRATYMINCAHPTHYMQSLDGGAWTEGGKSMRASASHMSHAELDVAEEVDDSDPVELGAEYAELCVKYPKINALGGCNGTDHSTYGHGLRRKNAHLAKDFKTTRLGMLVAAMPLAFLIWFALLGPSSRLASRGQCRLRRRG